VDRLVDKILTGTIHFLFANLTRVNSVGAWKFCGTSGRERTDS